MFVIFRELHELKKPVDNPEVLRFFKYMKAAKSGQNGSNCHLEYKSCKTMEESTVPAMIVTFNEINKLVQARKLNSM